MMQIKSMHLIKTKPHPTKTPALNRNQTVTEVSKFCWKVKLQLSITPGIMIQTNPQAV